MTTWTDFLEQQHTQPMSELLDLPQSQAVVVAMTQHTLLELEGPDSFVFLQGQVTCDVRRLEEEPSVLGAHCNSKGRMVSSFRAAKIGEQKLGLRLRSDLLPEALSQLEKYIVFSKAKVRQSEAACITIFGDYQSILQQLSSGNDGDMGTEGLIHSIANEDSLELWLDLSEEHAAKNIQRFKDLSSSCVVAPPEYFDYRMILNGMAEVQGPSREMFIPQEFNYQLVDAVSFKKGCYTGQEIVARMQYRGKLKKHLYRLSFSSDEAPHIGDKLVDEAGKTQAELVACVYTNNSYQALAVANLSAVSNNRLQIVGKNLDELQWLELPYAIPND